MKECWIFGSSFIEDYSKYDVPQDAFVIAADGGYSHVKKLGIKPDLILGDFDSLNEKLPDDCDTIIVPSRKDDTDMMLAVKKALEKGYCSITICGALGGRLDHTIANIQTLEFIYEHGGNGRIFSESNIVMLQSNSSNMYPKIDGFYFSIFSLTDETVVTTTGTKYNLTDYSLTRAFPLGVSNEILSEQAEITVKSGKLLILYSKK